MDPKDLFTSEEFLTRIDRLCKKRCFDDNEADECYLSVLEKLERNDFARLRAFRGDSKFSTYTYVVVNRLISEFIVPGNKVPKVVQRLGDWAVSAYRLLCWKRLSLEEAYDLLLREGAYQDPWAAFMEDVRPVEKAPCRQKPRSVSLDELGENGFDAPAQDDNPLERLLEKLDGQRRIIAGQVIREVSQGLDEEDLMLVKLVYASDLPVSQACKVVGLSDPQARRRLKKLLLKFRAALLKKGVREA
jgi:RNA polymerase sigma factor (sigma-70 family)